MAFDSIDTAEIQVKKPVTRSLLQKIKDSLDFLNGRIGTIELQGVQNGSFEIDSDADGVPDNWTRTLYPGGLGGIVSDVPAHGGNAIRLVHPGGAGNGGGSFESDYCPCSTLIPAFIGFVHWSTAGGMHNQLTVRFFDKSKVYLSASTLYDSVNNPTAPTHFIMKFTPPANARYYKIGLIGGAADVNVAGTAYFDGLAPAGLEIHFGQFSDGIIDYASSTNSAGFVEFDDMSFPCPYIGLPVVISFTAQGNGDGYIRFRLGAYYSNTVELLAVAAWTDYTFALTIPAGVLTGSATIYMQMQAVGTIYGKKLAGFNSISMVAQL